MEPKQVAVNAYRPISGFFAPFPDEDEAGSEKVGIDMLQPDKFRLIDDVIADDVPKLVAGTGIRGARYDVEVIRFSGGSSSHSKTIQGIHEVIVRERAIGKGRRLDNEDACIGLIDCLTEANFGVLRDVVVADSGKAFLSEHVEDRPANLAESADADSIRQFLVSFFSV
jgi:hypothetical protein